MTTPAIITMVFTMAAVTAFAGYFLWKVIRSPLKKDDGEEPAPGE